MGTTSSPFMALTGRGDNTCYNWGGQLEKRNREDWEQIYNLLSVPDCSLQLDLLKLESLGNRESGHVTVNTGFPGVLVTHRPGHTMGVDFTPESGGIALN